MQASTLYKIPDVIMYIGLGAVLYGYFAGSILAFLEGLILLGIGTQLSIQTAQEE